MWTREGRYVVLVVAAALAVDTAYPPTIYGGRFFLFGEGYAIGMSRLAAEWVVIGACGLVAWLAILIRGTK